MSIFENKNVICLVQTPFQLLGILSLFCMGAKSDAAVCDLVILDQFPMAREYADRIERSGFFSAVECIDASHWSSKHQGHRYLFEALLRPIANEKRFRSATTLFLKNKYDVLVCSSATRIALEIKRYLLPDGETVFFDDGIGSHNGGVFTSFGCLDMASFCRLPFGLGIKGVKSITKYCGCLLAGKRGQLNISRIYLFHPSAQDYERYGEDRVEQLDIDALRQNLALFDPSFKKSPERTPLKAVYLALPDDAPSFMLDVEKKTIEILKAYETDLTVRRHPRSQHLCSSIYSNGDDWGGLLWEALIVGGTVTCNTRLYGMGSSAQIHPKTLFAVEPDVIFLHKLLPEGSVRKKLDKQYLELLTQYSEKTKVIAPENEFELALYARTMTLDNG